MPAGGGVAGVLEGGGVPAGGVAGFVGTDVEGGVAGVDGVEGAAGLAGPGAGGCGGILIG